MEGTAEPPRVRGRHVPVALRADEPASLERRRTRGGTEAGRTRPTAANPWAPLDQEYREEDDERCGWSGTRSTTGRAETGQDPRHHVRRGERDELHGRPDLDTPVLGGHWGLPDRRRAATRGEGGPATRMPAHRAPALRLRGHCQGQATVGQHDQDHQQKRQPAGESRTRHSAGTIRFHAKFRPLTRSGRAGGERRAGTHLTTGQARLHPSGSLGCARSQPANCLRCHIQPPYCARRLTRQPSERSHTRGRVPAWLGNRAVNRRSSPRIAATMRVAAFLISSHSPPSA